jgi:hypothetical protein
VGKGKAILIPPGMAFAMHISKPTRITVYSSDDRNCQIPWPLLDGVGNPLNKVRPLQQIA